MTLSLDMLRHGVTDAGPGFRGSSDDALTEQGRQQMQLALSGKNGWDLVISSPLQRCARFAEELAATHSLPLHLEPDVRELHFGDWEGRSAAALMETDAEALGRFWADPYAFTPPNGEPLLHFEARILAALQRLQQRHAGERLLLITHGGVMRLLLARARGLPRQDLLQVNVGYAQRFRLRLDTDGQLAELP